MLAFENGSHALDVDPVARRLRGIEADKLNFLDLEYFAMVDLAYHARLGDHHQIFVDLHIDYAV